MAPAEHLDWVRDATGWVRSLDPDDLGLEVPACPGWQVVDVVNHLSFGLGLGYRYALRAPVDATAETAFAEVPWPERWPARHEALSVFSKELDACIDDFERVDPSSPCWTYAGPGEASFWMRRAAIELSLHWMDVAEAVGLPTVLDDRRASDGVAEAITFALPFAAATVGLEPAAIVVSDTRSGRRRLLGHGEPVAEVAGEPEPLLRQLWGRAAEGVEMSGDHEAAATWSGLIEQAFAGR